MSTKWYKISLRPLGPFYFGNERTFGANNADYFATSNYFPQQTTLLGVLRYRLLEMRGWLSDTPGHQVPPPGQQIALIGNRGFDAKNTSTTQQFGAIRQLSPILIENEEGTLFPGPLNNGYSFSSKKAKEKEEAGVIWTSNNGGQRDYIPRLANYDYKKPREAHFISSNPGGTYATYEDIFAPYEKVGITKQKENEPNQKAFYKQKMFVFKRKDYRFTFYALLEEAEGEALKIFTKRTPRVPMGGERSSYHMTMITETPSLNTLNCYLQQSDQNQTRTQVILLSHSYVKPELFKECDFIIGQTQDFRHITSAIHYQGIKKSSGYQLLSKGSVLYPKEKAFNRIHGLLTTDASAFFQIGYNAFVHLEKGKVETYTYKLSKNNQYEPNY